MYVNHFQLIKQLILIDLKERYKNSFLGIIWATIQPVIMLIIFSFLFMRVFRIQIYNYPLYLLTGVLIWNFFVEALKKSSVAFKANQFLVKNINFKREILPLYGSISATINYLIVSTILFLALMVYKVKITLYIFYLPVLLGLMIIFTYSLAFIFNVMYVYFEDTEHFLDLLLMVWFYSSPVFYSVNNLPSSLKKFYYINPMVPVLDSIRNIFLYGRAPDYSGLLYVFLLSCVVYCIGRSIFFNHEKKMVELI